MSGRKPTYDELKRALMDASELCWEYVPDRCPNFYLQDGWYGCCCSANLGQCDIITADPVECWQKYFIEQARKELKNETN